MVLKTYDAIKAAAAAAAVVASVAGNIESSSHGSAREHSCKTRIKPPHNDNQIDNN